ncbi:GmrSD restriction endonuclease domain-containing protein [Sunxiuqinia rutila]|uniref:GmrSD restriction endonuclease domain-containing protein n=1 Tax=Sunxiuqinia rutila TaxID=1397841 RepID=UPI003D361B58
MATSLLQLLKKYKVEIPIIQRDYAQGRQHGNVPKIRDGFLNRLLEACKPNAEILELDFVYGYIEEGTNQIFIPLDGQQRLTTLFLLHWFVAYKKNLLHEVGSVLLNFSYETRHSSRVFCEKLITDKILIPELSIGKDGVAPEENKKTIGEHIANQSWYFSGWDNDPTISSMLTMLDAIEEKAQNKSVDDLWSALWDDNAQIVFHQLDMTKLNLPDELYIKMNSRGKPLTNFEYFKSEFSKIVPDNKKEEFNDKIDKDWYDLFWYQLFETKEQNGEEIKDIAKFVDESFLKFFRYITDIFIARQQLSINQSSFPDEISYFKHVYTTGGMLENLFEIFEHIKGVDFKDYFAGCFYTGENNQGENAIRLFFSSKSTQLFNLCSANYDPSQRSNPFSIGEQLLFYAAIYGIVNGVEEAQKTYRKIRNLIANSEDTVRKDNMHNLLVSVEQVMEGKPLDKTSKFNSSQIRNEEDKEAYLRSHPESETCLYQLEDNSILQGCTTIFDLDDLFVSRAQQFLKTFNESNPDYRSIKRAMFSCGDYSQFYGSSKSKTDKIRWGVWMHYQLGANNQSQWRELFTPSNLRVGYANTKSILNELLDKLCVSNLETIIDNYLQSEDTIKDWRYYYIKYKECRHMPKGYSSWIMDKKYQYHSRMMNSTQLNGQNWSPYLFCIHKKTQERTSLENYDNSLIVFNEHGNSFSIRNYNSWYVVKVLSENEEELNNGLTTNDDFELFEQNGTKELRYAINQNADYIDLEDRVEKGLKLVEMLLDYQSKSLSE